MTELLARVQAAVGDAYRVESELPAGGMSRIFLATEASLNRRVIVKVLPPELASEVSTARFRQEMELLARLQHPHILPILTTGSRGDILFYIMPFVAGESLRHRILNEGALPVGDSVRILLEVADALGYAHAAGVLHRDVKPENILLEGRHAVLADFGVARALADARTGGRLTATGVAVGTPGYMSPEQVAGDVIDARAEVYALAVVGYEMLTGKPPFEGPTAQAVLTAHLTTPPLPLSEVRPEVPLPVSRAIARALSKQPEERFSNAQAFAEALSGGGPAREGAALGIGSRRGRLWLAGGVLAVAMLGFVALRLGGGGVPAEVKSRIRTAADSGRLDELARLIDSAGVPLSAAKLGGLASRVAGTIAVRSTPSGAEVAIARATPLNGFPKRSFTVIGHTPLERSMVAGDYVVRLSLSDYPPRYLLVRIPAGGADSVVGGLLRGDSLIGPLVRVEAGPSPIDGAPLEAFELGQFEITNAQFERFVRAGGYRDPGLWPDSLLIDGRLVPAAQGMLRLVDRTGIPGPRNWESGKFSAGQGDFPVTGVSWYEAAAYALWAHGRLPNASQWWRAASGDSLRIFPWGIEAVDAQYRANLEGVATAPVGSFPLGVSRFGAMDMAGNVREWLWEPEPDGRRTVAGGSWQDPFYMADHSHSERFFPWYASDALGFRVVRVQTRR